MTNTAWWLLCWGLVMAPCAMAQPQSLSPTYWQQRQFFIPYQVNQGGKLLDPIAKVQLLVSQAGATDWKTLQEAEPNVQGFAYHAPQDGEYWFALRHLDRRGRPWPNDDVRPQMRIVVDTQQPEITLEGSMDTNGEIVIRYEARDVNLQPETLILEVRGADDQWTTLQAGEPDLAQPNRWVGRVRWQPPSGTVSAEARAAVADRAGHRAQADTKVTLTEAGPALDGPSFGNHAPTVNPTTEQFAAETPTGPQALANPFANFADATAPQLRSQLPSQLPSQDWPATNQLPLHSRNPYSRDSPPQSNSYTASAREAPKRPSTQLVGDHLARRVDPMERGNGLQSLQVTPLDSTNAPPLMDSTPWAAKSEPIDSQGLWSAPTKTLDSASRMVNSQTFDIEYDLQSVGPWGVSKVELWGTADNGQTWRSYGVDSDNRSPARVTVPDSGTFGFRILVDGANSAGSPPPQSGDEPELTVSVDLRPPAAKLLNAELGQGNLADHLLVSWSATDTNLEQRPIALFYSSYPNGPWSTIAAGLENSGSYTWRIERHVPSRFYLRLEARDTAGNVATYQTSSPVVLARPQPTGHLRNVRPITNDE